MSTESPTVGRAADDPGAGTAAVLTGADILARVRGASARVRQFAEQAEQQRHLPRDLVEELRACGVFRATMPADRGGPEMTSMEQVALVEEVSGADASTGWCVMIGMDSGIYAGHLPPDVARRMYPELDMITAGQVASVGCAHEVDGGFRIEGRWAFGSGCTHADRITGGCVVHRDGHPVLDERGRPRTIMFLTEADDVTFEDTWHSTGLAGTGSRHYTAENLFVPYEHTFRLGAPHRRGPLYHPDALLRKMSGVPLGIARAALDHVYGLGQEQSSRRGSAWRRSSRIRSTVADCEMRLAAARAGVYVSLERQWEQLAAEVPLTPRDQALPALARHHAFHTARQVVQTLYDLVGGEAVYRGRTPLERQLRDVITACQHIAAQHRVLEKAGGILFGDPVEDVLV
ncbi:acyl-CoA dehydrogenase family protein [Nonomuraea spiralis]|uniref:acyl-CoA dehydrogenase family protein n=1 Tax=Nonomuraea spiralis TaxID=46182 RepID=UPI00378FB3AB